MTDWYRKTTWTKEDEEYFFAKLARARKDGRAQYLKLQAATLIGTKDLALIDIAEVLLLKLLSDYPDNRIEKSISLKLLGDIYMFHGNFQKAMTYYEESIAFERIFPYVHAGAYLEYSEIIVKRAISEKYSLAMELLLKEEPGLMFPISKYKVYSLLSILSRYMGNNDQTAYYAKLAEENANAQNSGLRYHKYLGVVEKRDKELDNLVKKNGSSCS